MVRITPDKTTSSSAIAISTFFFNEGLFVRTEVGFLDSLGIAVISLRLSAPDGQF
jgi:hypothetical protein